MHKRWVAALMGCSAVWLWSGESNAQALHGFTWDHATVHGGPRYATDDLNFGLGINGGYTLDQGVYLGGVFDYFFGETEDFNTPGGSIEAGFDAWFLMFEGGYDFGLADPFVLRATGALGMATAHARVCVSGGGLPEDCESDSESEFAGALGGNAIYDAGGLTLGGEIRFFFGSEFSGVWMGFNIGGVF